MQSKANVSLSRYLSYAALFAFFLSPLFGLGNIIARNREIANAGRMQQARLDEATGAWRSEQWSISAAYQMLAASQVNEATVIGKASKAMAAQDVQHKKTAVEELEQVAKQKELKIAAVVTNYTSPPMNGRTVILSTFALMIASAAVWQRVTAKEVLA